MEEYNKLCAQEASMEPSFKAGNQQKDLHPVVVELLKASMEPSFKAGNQQHTQ